MNVNDLMKQIDIQLRNNAAKRMMSLGGFIEALEGISPDLSIRMDFSYDGPGKMESYRGFYNHLALMGTTDNATVGSVLEDARSAIGSTFSGYKGGDYTMDESTPIWWARVHSECHDTGVVGVTDDGYTAVIHTAYVVL